MDIRIPGGWENVLKDETTKEYYINLMNFLEDEYSNYEVFPPKELIYSALETTSFEDVKVVIVGQDPYHDVGQAHGMAFSVQAGVKTPKSLQNIYKELNQEMGLSIPNNGYLKKWADQGVLLINNVLTVRAHEADSHKKSGWEYFTTAVIEALNKKTTPVVFLLWGNNAKSKGLLINNPKHLILSAAHPSPLSASRGFFGCNHFKLANEFLIKNKIKPIDWQIEDI